MKAVFSDPYLHSTLKRGYRFPHTPCLNVLNKYRGWTQAVGRGTIRPREAGEKGSRAFATFVFGATISRFGSLESAEATRRVLVASGCSVRVGVAIRLSGLL